MTTVSEWWYGQGDEVGGRHERTRTNPGCEMVLEGRRCDLPATELAETGPRYPSSMYWCPEHARMLREYVEP